MTALSLWWSFLWRLTAALFVLSFAIHPLAQVLLSGIDPVAAIKYRPSVAWWLFAATFWAVGAASPRFVRAVLWGERLGLADAQWLTFCRGIAVFFVALGFANILVANVASTDTWVNFKLFAAFPLLVIALAPLALLVRRRNAQSNP